MPILPNGPMHAAVEAIRQAIADCHYWTGNTYIDALPRPASGGLYTVNELATARPFALIQQAPGDGWDCESKTAGGDCYIARGHVRISFEFPVPDSVLTDSALGLYVLTQVGRVIWTGDLNNPGLLDLSGQPGRPYIRRVSVGDYGRVPPEDVKDLGDFVAVDVDLYWGNDG
ncbi:hypothetical protein [Allorhodopirellula heiligendammensis]|uniref:Uncharacterized protein n=1 Tax=Allorhodopirellula heiligendammensis TaxID=2714739 RepID=A0A5C6BUL5_9BACT|nr:hypothetical protein [Allorhodopirellula heiligendammensis]TWU15960.1 hypothetical protein Poly21_31640 [Allorhodopirellula heiligendammensis]